MREMGDRAFYCIVSLWCYTAENCPDGNLGDMDATDVADASDWQGDAPGWLNYLIDNRWLDRAIDGLRVHDWEQMQPWAARDRTKQSEANRDNALKRWGKVKSDANRISSHMQSQCEGEMQSQCPQPNPYPSHPIQNTPSISPVPGDGEVEKVEEVEKKNPAPKPEPVTLNRETLDLDNLTAPRIEAPDAGTGPASPRSAGNKGEPKEKKEPTATPKAAINHSITFDPATFTLHGITDADRAQWQGYAPGVNVDTELDAFLDYMQTHPEALQRTLKTGAWKAAINTRFRNAAKYGATMTKAKRPDAERDPFAGKFGDVGQPPKPKPLAIKPSSKFDWPATKKILESTLEPDLYARWIEPLTYEGMSERGAVLVAADQYTANYVWYNLRDPLGDAILVAHGLAVPFCCLSRSSLAGAGS